MNVKIGDTVLKDNDRNTYRMVITWMLGDADHYVKGDAIRYDDELSLEFAYLMAKKMSNKRPNQSYDFEEAMVLAKKYLENGCPELVEQGDELEDYMKDYWCEAEWDMACDCSACLDETKAYYIDENLVEHHVSISG